MRPQPLICVDDVKTSSQWYQAVLNLVSAHGGDEYERLESSSSGLVIQLHNWEAEHHHGPIGDASSTRGNGVLLWFEVDDFDAALNRIEKMRAEVVRPKHRNPPEGNGGPNHWEVWVRDPNGYTIVLASPDGTADGAWKS